MDKKEFLTPFQALCEACNKKYTKALASMYYMILAELTVEEFNFAIKNILTTRVYSNMPMPAEILQAVKGNPDDTALLAFDQLDNAVRTVGSYSSVCFKDRNLMATVDALGGWVKICQLTEHEWNFFKKDFLSFYKAISKGNKSRSTPEYLKGITQHQNQSMGFQKDADAQSICLIGFGIDIPRITAGEFEEKKHLLGIEYSQTEILNKSLANAFRPKYLQSKKPDCLGESSARN